jgi:ribosome biogenesis GTPase
MTWWSDDSGEESLADRFDEADVRQRPNRKGTRPRTKNRPEHADALTGMVLAVDRGRYTVLVDDARVTCSRARELTKQAIVAGDLVDVVGDVSGDTGSLARIVRVQERTTVLRRSADDTDAVERVIVANADQLLIVIAAANPEPRVRLVDRYLVAAFDAGIKPLLVITKCDIADPEHFLANFAGLDIPIFRSGTDEVPLEALSSALIGHTTVAVGHSGVGKSTLVNALVPAAQRATGHVNEVTGRGRHTSSSTICFELETSEGSGWIIDTPGVRSFGLGHVNPDNILGSFPDLAAVAEACPRGCSHLVDAPDCAINEALHAGSFGESGDVRVDSLQRLLQTFRDKPLARAKGDSD